MTLALSNYVFFVNVSPPKPLDVATSNFAGARVVLGNIVCDLDCKGQGQIMYYLVNRLKQDQIGILK